MKNNIIYKHRFLIARRIVQISILLLYIAGNVYGWKILQGNLSSSKLFDVIPLADPYATLQLFATGALLATDVIIGALIVLFFYMFIGGRAFCSWVCPINMVTDLANWIRVKTGIHREEWQLRLSRKVRYWVLGLSLVVSFIIAAPAFELISPISMLHRGLIFGMGFGWVAVLGVFLFDLFVTKNGWCGHVCPLGGFFSLVTKPSAVRVKHDADKCTLCMNCKNICPEKQVLWMVGKESVFVSSGECTNCGRCIEVCNDDALNFGFRYKPNKEEKNNA
ncbi:quinol dehydrogenase ferredoxin subunit NapH [Persephonella sp. KM09-Lau-8]|uniref:quinol dehydrogenase ferredoxin subunit NapH n=1 Tax=Persephonella sp. KM09-Lau-8 TaxID=1158345 RepID=UPI000497C7BF|nr:quinol dehydrogenase ferredoxin subunit NapH [Persephonella sp. KM09-Lau-8]